jgi:hypothetical protein
MNKQTSIEWLFQRFEDGDMYNVEDAQFIKHQAKQMHKEEIIDTWVQATPRNIPKYEAITKDFAERFYQETYGGNNE